MSGIMKSNYTIIKYEESVPKGYDTVTVQTEEGTTRKAFRRTGCAYFRWADNGAFTPRTAIEESLALHQYHQAMSESEG
jgi:uncharacterized protein YPO0396